MYGGFFYYISLNIQIFLTTVPQDEDQTLQVAADPKGTSWHSGTAAAAAAASKSKERHVQLPDIYEKKQHGHPQATGERSASKHSIHSQRGKRQAWGESSK